MADKVLTVSSSINVLEFTMDETVIAQFITDSETAGYYDKDIGGGNFSRIPLESVELIETKDPEV